MAARAGGAVHEQALNYLVTNGPWPVEPVRARIAEPFGEAVAPAAWAIDGTGLLKCGTAPPCVARCVSIATDTASCPEAVELGPGAAR